MAIDISKQDLVDFKRMTGVDVQFIFVQCATFFTDSYNRIVSFYSGAEVKLEKGDFTIFEDLKREIQSVFAAYRNHANQLNNLRWWLLLEKIEDIDSRFGSLAKINKWSKSSLTFVGYDPAQQVHYTLKPKQTLERVSQDVLQKGVEGWIDIALTNQIEEEDYTPAGGNDLLLSFPRVNNGISINSVVDVMVGKNIYGKDFDKKIQFDPVTGDLKVLSPDNTINQAVFILANLRKNDHPDFPEHGLQSNIVIGGNRAALNFPVITRQFSETFAIDDSLKNFQLAKIDVTQDNLTIFLQVETRLNEIVDEQVIV